MSVLDSVLAFDRSAEPKTVLVPAVLDALDHRRPSSDPDELARLETMFHAPAALIHEAFDGLRRVLDPLLTLLNLAGYEVDAVAVGFAPMASLDDVVAVMNIATAEVHVEPIEHLTGLYERSYSFNDQFLALRVVPRHLRAPDPYAGWPDPWPDTSAEERRLWVRSAAPKIAIPLDEPALSFPHADFLDFVKRNASRWFLDPLQEGWLLLIGEQDGPSPSAAEPIAFGRFFAPIVELRDRVIAKIMDKLGDNPKANLWSGKWVHAQRGLIASWDPASWLFDGETNTGQRTKAPRSANARMLVELGDAIWKQIDARKDGESSLQPRDAFELFLREEIGAGPTGEYGSGIPRPLLDRFAANDAVGEEQSPIHGSDFVTEVFAAVDELARECAPGDRPDLFTRADAKLISYTQLILTVLELRLFECPALLRRPVLPSLPRPGHLNAHALAARSDFVEMQGYSLGDFDGVWEHIYYPTADGVSVRVLKGHPNHLTYCVGITIDIFIRAWRRWSVANRQPDRIGHFDHGGLLSFIQPWYNNWAVQGPGCYAAVQRFGLGVPIAVLAHGDTTGADRALPGDFVQLMREPTTFAGPTGATISDEGNGHSVMFLAWVDADENDWISTSGDAIAGIRYWSTQGKANDGGIREKIELFSDWGTTSWKVYVMRAGRV